MSTYWYFECVQHMPPIRSEDEFTQHTDDDAFKRAMELAQSRPVDAWENGRGEFFSGSIADYYEQRARRFLAEHPDCPLVAVSEYGVRRHIEVAP